MKLSTKLTAAMIAVALFTAATTGLLIYREVTTAALPRALDRLDMHTRLIGAELAAKIGGVRADASTQGRVLDALASATIAGGIHPVDGTTAALWRERLASRFIAELNTKSIYSQYRLIGVSDGGREIVRVDRRGPGGAIRVTPDASLQRKGDRDYFKAAIALPPGGVYVSPIDLNQEDGAIETPHVPTLRAASPIFAPDGTLFGILIINVDMRSAFAAARSAALPGAQVYIANDNGDYLVHPDPSLEFGFEFGNSKRIQDDFPEYVQFQSTNRSEPQILRDRSGGYLGLGWETIRLAGASPITVIETMPYTRLFAAGAATRNATLVGGLVAVLGALVLAVILARSLTKPLVQMTQAVTVFPRNESIVVPITAKDEIGVLARAFTRMAHDVRENATALKRTADERRLADEKFRLAVEASPSGLVMINVSGAIVLVNAETERLFGYERNELIGQSVDILVPTRLQGQHDKHRSEFAIHPETRRMGAGRDLYGLRKDGTEFPVEIGLNPIHTEGGILILSVIVDISERKRAEAALQQYAEREQLFIAAVESSNDAIVTKSLDGTITSWNPGAERLFGYTAQDAIGSNINIIVPDDRRTEIRNILARIGRGEKIDHHETVRVAKDGRRIDMSLSVSPVRSPSGVIVGASKIARDITASKQAQAALLDSERTARGIIDTAMDAFIQMDESGNIVDWNSRAETIFGWSRGEAVGKGLADLIVPERYRASHKEGLRRFLHSGESSILGKRLEIEALRRDGKEMKVELSVTALRRQSGHVFNAFIEDLTEKIAADEQLRQSQKMEAVGQLTGGIAHDFNNMLTVITGTIEILADAVADRPQLAAIAKLISEAADRGAELTGHLLAFARRQPLQPRETNINALMAEAAKLLRPTLGEHVDIELKMAEDVWPALVDPTQLTTALLNLSVNARDAMPEGGKLILETENIVLDESYAKAIGDIQPGNYVLIAVSDTGTGIPEGIRDKIFEPFFSTKEVGKGTGLGLSMVYGFVKQSGGHIKIYSEQGHGTTIRIYLPRAVVNSEQLAEVTPQSLIERGNETILLVEDDAMVRTSAITQLESLGYQTISAANAADALTIVDKGTPFDLLFTDVIMPGAMNGRQLAEETAKRRPEVKVLFTSGYTEDAIIHHGRLDPGVLLLAKPYRKAELARMLRLALGATLQSQPSGTDHRQRATRG
jgi:PAS domain S-box-containing protein